MIYDISQPVFGCRVYPGDSKPAKTILSDMQQGALYNLTEFSMCAHNGTHVDAPAHFISNGKHIDELPLEQFVGPAWVARHSGNVTARDAECILQEAAGRKKILIAGDAVVTLEAAQIFAKAGLDLLGNESQSVGPVDAPMAVHLALLGAGVLLLEGLNLKEIPVGAYLLNCAPLNLNGLEGAPCRALLID